MIRVRSFVVLAGVSLVIGCATQGPSAAPPLAAAHGNVAAAAVSAGSQTASAASPGQLPQSTSAAPQSAPAVAQNEDATRGYDRVVINGKRLFCRSEAVTGMRINQRVCFTQDELETAQKNTQQLMLGIERQNANGKPMQCRTMGSAAPC
jgi:hypothetical protein